MASNFLINIYNFGDTIFIRLSGDFNEVSANELIAKLMEQRDDFLDIFVDTNELKTVHPFDRNIFQKNLDIIKILFKNFFIIGVNKHRFELGLEQ